MTMVLIGILCGLFYSLWRRCYGGWDSDLWKKWFPNHGSALHRWFWRAVSLIFIFCISFFVRDIQWSWALYSAGIMHFVFWDWTFGMYMGIGRHALPPPQEDIDEYNEQVFAPFLNWLFDEDDRYGAMYDFIGMLLRFSAPGLLMFFVPTYNMGIFALGTFIALAYFIEARFNDKQKTSFICKNFSELASGFVTGLALVLF